MTVDAKRLSDLENILGRHLPEPAAEPVGQVLIKTAEATGELMDGLGDEDHTAKVEKFVRRYFDHFEANSTAILNRIVDDTPTHYLKGLVQLAQATLNKGGLQVNIQNNVTLASKLFDIRNNRGK